MDELVQWLRAQLDEDERIAREATERQPYDEWDAVGAGDDDDVSRSHWEVVKIARMSPTPAARSLALHIAEWDPARVLAEVDAKRQIVDLCKPPLIDVTGPGEGPPWGLDVLKLLALPYADRPGYREEWRP